MIYICICIICLYGWIIGLLGVLQFHLIKGWPIYKNIAFQWYPCSPVGRVPVSKLAIPQGHGRARRTNWYQLPLKPSNRYATLALMVCLMAFIFFDMRSYRLGQRSRSMKQLLMCNSIHCINAICNFCCVNFASGSVLWHLWQNNIQNI